MIGQWLLAMHALGALLWVVGLCVALFVLRPRRQAVQNTRLRRLFLVIWHAMPIVLLTGYGLLFGVYGGFAGVGWNVHVMHLLGLIMAALFITIFFGPYAALRRGEARSAVATRRLLLVNLILGVCTIVVAAWM